MDINIVLGIVMFFRFLICCPSGNYTTIVTVIFDDDPTTGYRSIAPVYDVAMEKVISTYSSLAAKLVHYSVFNNAINVSQELPATIQIVTDVYHLLVSLQEEADVTAIFSSGRTKDVHLLGDFAREMNVPLFASSATDSALADRSRFPTTFSFAPSDNLGYAPVLRAYFDHFSWRYITVLCDNSSDFLTSGPANSNMCSDITSFMTADRTAYEEQLITFDADRSTSFTSLLSSIRSHGKIIIAVTRESIMRRLMIDASGLGMTNGKYVFIYLQPLLTPDSQVLSWMYHDRNDVIAYEAFKNLIVISYVGIQWSKINDLLTSFSDKSSSAYSTKRDPKQLNAYAVTAYESMLVFAKVWNETTTDSQKSHDGNSRKISDAIVGHKFGMDSGQIDIGSNGLRRNGVVIFGFNSNAKSFQPVWYFSSETTQLVGFKSDAGERWPVDVSDKFDLEKPPLVLPPQLGFSIVMALIGTAVMIWSLYVIRGWQRARANNSTWWQFDHSRFEKFNYKKTETSTLGLTAANYGFALSKLEDETVCLQTSTSEVTFEDIKVNNGVRQTLSEIRALQHSHIGRLYGITIYDNKMHLIWQFGRCTLRALLDDEKFQMDIKLKTALIFELINGVEAIHGSPLEFHGSLSSLTVTLDAMYSIKICGVGSSSIFDALTKSRCPLVNTPLDMWLAPEMLKNHRIRGSKEADMYAVGLLICEILTGSSVPLDIDTPDSTFATWTWLTGILGDNTVGAARRLSSAAAIPDAVRKMILDCFKFDPHDRPTILQLRTIVARYYKATSVMEQMLRRYQAYSDNLELTVAVRTDELIQEEAKTVALLEEMIPRSLVASLRNREPIPAESFDCVTLFFSSLVGFAEFCRLSTPLAIINLLNTTYTTFDQELQDYDVYKVETVKDGYMIASGLPLRNGDMHASEIASMAQNFVKESLNAQFLQTDTGRLELRIGIHSGTVAACVVGNLMPRYCLFGDTVNTASRMESFGASSKIHVSSVTAELLQRSTTGTFYVESRGLIAIKGKGTMETFWLEI